MRDATAFGWTTDKPTADSVAYGPPGAPYWLAEVPFALVVSNKTGPKDIAVNVYANHGNWVVQCPDCGGGQLACPDDHRFMCNNCANVMVDSLWRPVVWPKNRAAIDEVLMKRKLPMRRNWYPRESLADLKAENVEHGVA